MGPSRVIMSDFNFHDGDLVVAVAEVEPGLAVVVDEDVGIDGADSRFVGGDERLSKCVFERASGRIGDGDADLVVRGKVEVVLSIPLDAVGRPGVLGSPLNVFEAEDHPVILPVKHVVRREDMPVNHVPILAACDVVRWVDIQSAIEDPSRGVGLKVRKDLMLGQQSDSAEGDSKCNCRDEELRETGSTHHESLPIRGVFEASLLRWTLLSISAGMILRRADLFAGFF